MLNLCLRLIWTTSQQIELNLSRKEKEAIVPCLCRTNIWSPPKTVIYSAKVCEDKAIFCSLIYFGILPGRHKTVVLGKKQTHISLHFIEFKPILLVRLTGVYGNLHFFENTNGTPLAFFDSPPCSMVYFSRTLNSFLFVFQRQCLKLGSRKHSL